MSTSGTRVKQRGAILLGCAGGLLVASGGLAAAYYAISTRSVAGAATLPEPSKVAAKGHKPAATAGQALTAYLATPIAITLSPKLAPVTTKTHTKHNDENKPDELG